MNREQAKENIQSRAAEYLKPDKSKKGYICPLCGSGSGKNGTGITTKDKIHYTCWAGCFTNADIIDIIGQQYGLTDYNSQLKKAAEIFNISFENDYTRTAAPAEKRTEPEEKTDLTNFFLKAYKDINKTDYPQKRGLSQNIIDRFKLGYIEAWQHPKAPNATPSPRLIIPTSKYSYIARDTRQEVPEVQKAYKKMKAGELSIFNKRALREAQKPIFIVEGEIDALSIIEAGGEAVGLGTITVVKKFLEEVKQARPKQPFIISLDNEEEIKTKEKVEKAIQDLENGLKSLNIRFYRYNVSGIYKDPNEALIADREAFIEAVKEAEELPGKEEQQAKEEYLKTSTDNYLQGFIDGITESVNTPFIPTGFKNLDNVLDGGLYEGLYIVGAISSLGKTTLVTQIADQVAQSGTDVIIFSLEMARAEIMAKSISRHTYQSVLKNGGKRANAKTSRGITTGKRYEHYNPAEMALINESIAEYSKYAKNIYTNEGIGDIGAEQIKETVKNHIKYTSRKPVIIIDYLQILAPYSDRATDKQNTDKSVMELKRISRDFKTPVIGISSFNRASYKEAVTMEAFKESGAIEYSSDILIGLQLKGAGKKDFEANEAKSKDPREIELIILKNRNGKTGEKIEYKYYAPFNLFIEVEESEYKTTKQAL